MMAGAMIWSNIQQAAVFSVLQAEFLALASASSLQYPAVYLITDIENGLYVQTLTDSTYSNEAILSFLAPDYALHAQYHSSDGAVAGGATVTWGGYYWTNISGGAITPNIPNNFNIDSNLSNWNKIAKSIANEYVEILLNVSLLPTGSSLAISFVADNKCNQYPAINALHEAEYSYTLLSWIDNALPPLFVNNQNVFIVNNKLDDASSLSANYANLHALIQKCKLSNGSSIGGNILEGLEERFSIINNCIVDGENSGIRINRIVDSELQNFSFSGDNIWAELNTLQHCIISNLTYAVDGLRFSFNNFSFKEERTINLTGWSRSVEGVSIVNGSGYFVIEHDFTAAPLNSGSSVFYNLIPTGARVTNILAIGDSLTGGAGATLAFGLETDAPTLIAADTLANVNAGKTYAGFSTPATANRSLVITAGVNNVTGGTVTVKVEFIL